MKKNRSSISVSGAIFVLCAFLMVTPLFSQTKPTVVSTNPAKDATGVSRDLISVTVTFSRPMTVSGPCVATNSLWVAPQGSACTWSGDQKTMTITRMGTSLPSLAAGSVVTIYLNYGSITLSDTDGNALDANNFSFTIATSASFTRIDANAAKGFSWPYYLWVPNTIKQPAILLVEPNNTGGVSDDPAVHDLAAKSEAQRWMSKMDEIGCPYMVPTFRDRPLSIHSRWIETHC